MPEGVNAEGANAAPVALSGDFVELFRFHYPRLRRALELAGAGEQAEDIAQEAFARTYGRWRQVQSGTNPAGYVFTTAFHLLRRRGMLPASPLDDEADPATGVAEIVATRLDFARALASMPPRRRACVILCWVSGATPAEAAQALGIADGTVRKQLELARRQAVIGLGDDGDREGAPG